MTAGPWVSLFSGGKDSSYALYLALERGLAVERLVTVHPAGDSYMYHVPATKLASLAADSIGIDLVDVSPGTMAGDSPVDAGAQGDRELEVLERALGDLDDDLGGTDDPGDTDDDLGGIDDDPGDTDDDFGGMAGVTVGAVESEFQASRIESMAERLEIDVFAPLWGRDPGGLAREMLDAGFEILIVQVAARGLDESWLGRRLDATAIADLEALDEAHGVHVLGEGGEFETLVTDGPHMDRAIELECTSEWDGTRGRLTIEDAWLS